MKWRSFLAGVAVACLVAVCVGQVGKSPAAPVGRYQVSAGEGRGFLIIDTTVGRVYRYAVKPDTNILYGVEVTRQGKSLVPPPSLIKH